jgi:sporulation protein YlmC with PRC-barrel domain
VTPAAGAVRLALGATVRCQDGARRELADIVVDSRERRVTHLVVQPADRPSGARLVPITLAEAGGNGGGEVALRCTAETLDQLETVHEFAYLGPGERPDEGADWDVGVEDLYVTPQYGGDPVLGEYGGSLDQRVGISYDRIPRGEVELRRASNVYTADEHHVGRVRGVVVDPAARIASVLLERGHLWWRREIEIPAALLSSIGNDTVTLSAPKRELNGLPSSRM